MYKLVLLDQENLTPLQDRFERVEVSGLLGRTILSLQSHGSACYGVFKLFDVS